MKNYRKFIIILLFFSFAVGEQQKARKIEQIQLIGVESITEKQLKDVMRLREPRFLSKMDYDRRLIKLDAISIKTLYISNGFLAVQVKDSVDMREKTIDVFFIVNEGNRYYINSVNISGNIAFNDDNILRMVGLQIGQPYNPVKVNANIRQLENSYKEIGKLFAEIQIADAVDDSVKVIIKIDEGEDVYVNNLYYSELFGLDSTIAKRELIVFPSELYQQKKINDSRWRLMQTSLFSGANIVPMRIAGSDSTVNLLVELRQFEPYEWISEGGYYPIEYYEGAEPVPGVGVDVGWRNRSLMNTGTNLSTKLTGQTFISEGAIYPKIHFGIGLTNQWFYKYRIPYTIQLYYEIQRDYGTNNNSYVRRYGVEVLNSFYFNRTDQRSYIKTRLQLDNFSKNDEILQQEVNATDALNAVQSGEIRIEKHSFNVNVRIDKSDNILYPAKGAIYLAEINRTGGILGGNRDYFKFDLGYQYYLPVYKQIVFAGRIKYGMIFGWEATYQDHLFDQFYLGGSNSLRAWDMLKFQTDNDGKAVGDVVRILNNWEIRFPIYSILGGEIFIDGGMLTENYHDLFKKRMTWNYGGGFTVSTPLGPIRLDFAHPLSKNGSWNVQLGVQYIF